MAMNTRRSSRHRWRLPVVLGLALAGGVAVAALLAAIAAPPGMGRHAFHGTDYGDPLPAPGFALTNHLGKGATLADHRGQVVLLFFGFTHCPDVCPLTLQRLSGALAELGRRAENVQVLLITVDPERDTPEVLHRYVQQFGPRVAGLTGDPEDLAQIRRSYGVFAEIAPAHGEHGITVVHSDVVFGVDRQGRLRVLLHVDGPREELLADIRRLLRL
jgi:protein SCO1